MQSSKSRHLARYGAAFLMAGSAVFADSVFVGSLERKDVTITAVREGSIEFKVAGHAADPVPLTRVSRIAISDEPGLNAAEQAYADRKFASAAEQYQAVLQNTRRPWLRDYVLPRMLRAAKSGERFPAAVAAYVALLPRNPKLAQENRPLPAGGQSPAELKVAVATLLAACGDSALKGGQRQAMLGLLLEVCLAQNDLGAATNAREQIIRLGTQSSSDPTSARILGDTHLALAHLALAEKNYDKAVAEVEAGRELFTDSSEQVAALYALALAKDAKLGEKPAADMARDVAIEYMRVVALSRKTAEQPYLAASLYRAGQLCEKSGDAKGAVALYADVSRAYAQTPQGRAARRDLGRLHKDSEGEAAAK